MTAFAFVASSSSAFAEGALTMDAAVDLALERSPELAAQEKAEAVSAVQADEARSAYWPRANLEAGYLFRTPKNQLPISLPPELGLPPIGDIDDVHRGNFALKVSYRLFDLARGERVDAALAEGEAKAQQTKEASAGLAFQVRAIFLTALLSRDLQEIAEESLRVAREEVRRAELRRDVGTGTETALAQARTREASFEAQRLRAANDFARHRALLASLLGMSPPTSAPSGAPAVLALDGELEALSTPIDLSTKSASPEVERLLAQARAARSLAGAEARAFLPTVSVQSSLEMVYPRAMKLEWGPAFQFGALLSWPFFDGFERGSRERRNELAADQLSDLAKAAEDRTQRTFIDLEARRKSAEADLASARQILRESEVYVRVAKAAVESGTGTELELHTAELGLDQARIAVERALFEAALVRAETLRALGMAKEELR